MVSNYKVLARIYRPKTFVDLVGQDVTVQTISNSIKTNRVSHAFLLSGIRGVGKTTIARIIARTLNCTNKKFENNIVSPCMECKNCMAFSQEKHPDILEIDAASRTGVNDVRELIENSKYLPILGQYKIFIIDEVHMLSNNAFNAFLKLLEEPPEHVKFVFATTEMRKIPVTIISRCQRFDLRRLTIEELSNHLLSISKKENIVAEDSAIKLIAESSGGSVRDSLSILDQALSLIDQNSGNVLGKELVLNMLGIRNKSDIYDLFDYISSGNTLEALSLVNKIYNSGSDAQIILESLLEVSYQITKLKQINSADRLSALSESDIKKLQDLAGKISLISLSLIWQFLLKGVKEIQYSPNSLMALEMLVIRVTHLSNMPSPADVINKYTEGIELISNKVEKKECKDDQKTPVITGTEDKKKISKIKSFDELVELFCKNKEMIIYNYLHEDTRLVEFKDFWLKINPDVNVPHNLSNQVKKYLKTWVDEDWVITICKDEGEMPLKEQKEILKNEQKKVLLDNNQIVKDILNNFDGAKVTNIKKLEEVSNL
jgi:DNA polymerase III subunit gamma/tau